MEHFLDRKNTVAVVGVSASHDKWGRKVYNELRTAGFRTYPVNPKYENIDSEKCYPDLESLPEKPDLVITIVPPAVTLKVVEQCAKLGIGRVWMQPGSESENAVKFCRENGIDVIYNACFVVNGLKKQFGD